MKVELTDISPVKKSMSIEVESAEMDQETQSVLKNYARKAKIPGFRPGKAPPKCARRRTTVRRTSKPEPDAEIARKTRLSTG